ncbi:hypothetical protein KR032_009004 [Drosophila birchii]|nr:hypothetical protein KR032_009004 [Drosophila birchii]
MEDLADTIVKFLLLLLNFIFSVLAVMLIGFWILFLGHATGNVFSIGENDTNSVITGLGGVILIILIFGCLTFIYQIKQFFLVQYANAVMLLILIHWLLFRKVSHDRSEIFNKGFERLWEAERNKTGALAYYENWLHCCGVNSSKDYGIIRREIPSSCCLDNECVDQSSVFKVGCKTKFTEYLNGPWLIFKVVCWLLVIVEVSCFIYNLFD